MLVASGGKKEKSFGAEFKGEIGLCLLCNLAPKLLF